MEDHPGIAHVIREWRRRVAETQEDLAHDLNVTFSTVSRWENGHVRPSNLAGVRCNGSRMSAAFH
jgi:putative transcriptional regulator